MFGDLPGGNQALLAAAPSNVIRDSAPQATIPCIGWPFDAKGRHLPAVTTTSGLPWKFPERVGAIRRSSVRGICCVGTMKSVRAAQTGKKGEKNYQNFRAAHTII